MKTLIKSTLFFGTAFMLTTMASGQELVKRNKVEKSKQKTEVVKKSPFDVKDSRKEVSINPVSQKKKGQKLTIWDVLPADGFVPTGDPEKDKEAKRKVQIDWAKKNPEEFKRLMKEHGIMKD